MKWHKGKPPQQGWWLTVNGSKAESWRWWNGEYWSFGVQAHFFIKDVERAAYMPTAFVKIRWCDYWPENARVPRVKP